MFYRALSFVLVTALLHGSIAAQDQTQAPQQTAAKMQEVVHKAQEKDKTVKVILNKKIDNQKKFSGKVSDVSDTGFVVTDQKTGATQRLAYADVREVRQKGMSKGWTIALVVIAGVIVAVIVATKPWQSE